MIKLKTPTEINFMKKGGKILSEVLQKLWTQAKPGVSLFQLDKLAYSLIISKGAKPSFKIVPGYRWAICACVNETVVHGIPDNYVLKKGDILGLDCGVYFKGLHTDCAWTKKIGGDEDEFLETGRKALENAIKAVKIGNFIFDISKAIEETIEEKGYSTVKSLVGHGIGRNLHEDPEIPCFTRGERENSVKIKEGMTLAIEVIYNKGSENVVYKNNDGWTIVTKDGKISGLFEATVAATNHGCLVLTHGA